MTKKTTENETAVLDVLFSYYERNEDFCCASFKGIGYDLQGLDRRRIRLACRSLTRKGLAEFHRGLWSDDGMPAGSGYCISTEGVKLMNERLNQCCLCKTPLDEEKDGFGHNPDPFRALPFQSCCTKCNNEKVIPERLRRMKTSRR